MVGHFGDDENGRLGKTESHVPFFRTNLIARFADFIAQLLHGRFDFFLGRSQAQPVKSDTWICDGNLRDR